MKILICTLNDSLGGAEQVLKMIAKYYANKGSQVDVFFLSKPEKRLWDNMNDNENIRLVYTGSKNKLCGFFLLYSAIKKDMYTYSFTSHVYTNSYIGLLRKLKLVNIKHAIGRDSRSYFLVNKGFKYILYSLLINLGYKLIDLLIAQTDEMKDQFILNKKAISYRLNIQTIPNPFDMEHVVSDRIDELYNKIKESNYIVAAGRLIKIKGFDVLIRAFKKLNLESFTLMILGEGEERENLENLIAELDLNDRVKLMGFENNVYGYFKYAKVCVISSRKEGFPNVLLQMMSQNTKVVITKCCGGLENIKGIFVCDPDNIDVLADAIQKSLHVDTESNRYIFDDELKNRSIEKFIKTIESNFLELIL